MKLEQFFSLVSLSVTCAVFGIIKGQTQGGDASKFCGKRVVCLYNTQSYYRQQFTPDKILPDICTHINYEFAKLHPTKYEIMEGDEALDTGMSFMKMTTDLKKKDPFGTLKVLLSLGGWRDSSKKYSELIASPEKRRNFIETSINYLKKKDFDGLDFAFEYPNCWQGAINISFADKANYVKFLEEMKGAYEKENLLLTVSVSAIKREIQAGYDVPKVSKNVDFINVMTYDMHGPWESTTGHHAQFRRKAGDEDPHLNIKGAMETWTEGGADRNKLNVGMVTYARTWTLRDPSNHGLGAPAIGAGKPGEKTNQEGFLAYNEVCRLLMDGRWQEVQDKDVGYYVYSKDQWGCYLPPAMVATIANFTVGESYGGVVIKDLSSDDFEKGCYNMAYPLIKVTGMEIRSAVRKLQRKNHEPVSCKNPRM